MPTAATPKDRALAALNRKLEGWELQHLRDLANELHDQVQGLQADLAEANRQLSWAENCALNWRNEALDLAEQQAASNGGNVGLTVTGQIVILPPEIAATPPPALNSAPHAAGALCAQVLVLASSTLDAANNTGYEFHKGAYKQTLAVLDLLRQQFPHSLQAAIAVLNDPVTRPGVCTEFRAAKAVQLAEQLIVIFGAQVKGLDDGVLPVDFHGQEAIDRANESNRAAEHAASVTQGGAQADAELDQLEAQGRQLDADIQRIHDAGGAR